MSRSVFFSAQPLFIRMLQTACLVASQAARGKAGAKKVSLLPSHVMLSEGLLLLTGSGNRS